MLLMFVFDKLGIDLLVYRAGINVDKLVFWIVINIVCL